MKQVKKLSAYCFFAFFALLTMPVVLWMPVRATSQQAYQDYLFQFDLYRQKNSAFQVAKNEYKKFKTLTSQTQALEATKAMLSQRDGLLRSYLFLLNEKLNENQGLNAATKTQYQTIIRNEVTFLDSHAQLIPSIGSLDDATDISRQLESHYKVLQSSERQIIGGLALGSLSRLSAMYDVLLTRLQTYVTSNAGIFTTQKQATINRWLLQITDKRTLFQQKYDAISQANGRLGANDARELDRQFNDITRMVGEAKQYLTEGTSYMGELMNAMRYQN